LLFGVSYLDPPARFFFFVHVFIDQNTLYVPDRGTENGAMVKPRKDEYRIVGNGPGR
jgi:hypothetical protein